MKWAVCSGLWGSQGLGKAAMLGLHDGKTALKVTLNMVWVDLVKMWRGRSGRSGRWGQGLISPSWGAFCKFASFFTLSTQRLCTNNFGICHLPGNTNAQGK